MALRVLVPLLGILAALAWGATLFVNGTTRSWFERDVALRARLVANGAREALAAHVRAGDRRKLGVVLGEIARDDRIAAAAICSPPLETLASNGPSDAQRVCESLAGRGVTSVPSSGVDLLDERDGGLQHTAVVPIVDEGQTLGHLVVVHDLDFVARREGAMRRFTVAAFGVVALLASIATVLVRTFTWRTWTEEIRKVLTVGRGLAWKPRARHERMFGPLLSDLRAMLADLAADQGVGPAGRWTPDRLHRVLTESLEGESVLILANREPYIHTRGDDGALRVQHPASGLVTALEPVMRACSGTWIAHGSGSADRECVDGRDRVLVPPGEESYAIRRVWLSREEERGYYLGFSNEGLWPLCHLVYTRPVFRVDDWRTYEAVNRRFAAAVCEEASGPDPVVLVQDYHFALAPRLIRERLPRATIISFWHIPWPNAERLGVCPWHRELLEGLLGSSIVGFHTQQHCNNFIEGVDRFLESRIDRERHSVVLGGRESLVRPYPISIEWPNHWATGAPPVSTCRREVFAELGLAPDALLGVGVDRLDYTKGIEERLLAVERTLERYPEFVGRFTFAQLAAPSRTSIPEYDALNGVVDALASRINARFAVGSWRPIALLRAHHEPPAVFRYLRAADLCYVSSLQDGMNLVAKEFVAAREDERGVLVLSRFTGAARELGEALLVNPYDLEEAGAALATALSMAPSEQAERMRAMRAHVSEFNVYRWDGRMLADAARLRSRDRLSTRLARGLAHPLEAVTTRNST